MQLILDDVIVNDFTINVGAIGLPATHNDFFYEFHFKNEHEELEKPAYENIRLIYILYSNNTQLIKMDVSAIFYGTTGTAEKIDKEFIVDSLLHLNMISLVVWRMKCREKIGKIIPYHPLSMDYAILLSERAIQSIPKNNKKWDIRWKSDDEIPPTSPK